MKHNFKTMCLIYIIHTVMTVKVRTTKLVQRNKLAEGESKWTVLSYRLFKILWFWFCIIMLPTPLQLKAAVWYILRCIWQPCHQLRRAKILPSFTSNAEKRWQLLPRVLMITIKKNPECRILPACLPACASFPPQLPVKAQQHSAAQNTRTSSIANLNFTKKET